MAPPLTGLSNADASCDGYVFKTGPLARRMPGQPPNYRLTRGELEVFPLSEHPSYMHVTFAAQVSGRDVNVG